MLFQGDDAHLIHSRRVERAWHEAGAMAIVYQRFWQAFAGSLSEENGTAKNTKERKKQMNDDPDRLNALSNSIQRIRLGGCQDAGIWIR